MTRISGRTPRQILKSISKSILKCIRKPRTTSPTPPPITEEPTQQRNTLVPEIVSNTDKEDQIKTIGCSRLGEKVKSTFKPRVNCIRKPRTTSPPPPITEEPTKQRNTLEPEIVSNTDKEDQIKTIGCSRLREKVKSTFEPIVNYIRPPEADPTPQPIIDEPIGHLN